MENKVCRRCNTSKDLIFFRKSKTCKDGHLGECKECEKQRLITWRLNNPEKYKAQTARQRERQKETGWEKRKEWRAKNPRPKKGRVLLTKEQKEISDRNCKIQWKKNNPELVRADAAMRLAKKKGAIIIEKIIPIEIFKRDNGVCKICGGVIEDKYELDHIIPLSKGGQHSHANIQLSHVRCNRKKHNKIEYTMIIDRT